MSLAILSTLDRLINDRLDANTKAITQSDSKQIVATANQLLALLDARKAIQEVIDDSQQHVCKAASAGPVCQLPGAVKHVPLQ